MYNGAMVPTSKILSDLFEGIIGVFFGKIHGNLSGGSHFFTPGFVFKIGNRN
jgi:hypothetical protein